MTPAVRIPAWIPATFCILLLCALSMIATEPAQAQTYTVLHDFNNFPDGATPKAGLTMDSGGNLYGTTSAGGDPECNNGFGCGTVFRLKATTHGWIVEVLQIFHGSNGLAPYDRAVFGPDGALYGTAAGGEYGTGVIFRLTPPPTICHAASCPWTETLLYQFPDDSIGSAPVSAVAFDQAGNFYGTTQGGGTVTTTCGYGCGVVYQMTRSGLGWTYAAIHYFNGNPDGWRPYSGVTFDRVGNLYGTTWLGGAQNYGTVYELTPSGGSWQESVLHSFSPYLSPYAGVTIDPLGNVYGGTGANGSFGGGSVYELSAINGGWNFTTLYGVGDSTLADLTMDSAGNLYGTASSSFSSGCGEVYELSPRDGSWVYRALHSFQGSDGCQPMSTVLMDGNGNLFGTTTKGGAHDAGVVWEISQ